MQKFFFLKNGIFCNLVFFHNLWGQSYKRTQEDILGGGDGKKQSFFRLKIQSKLFLLKVQSLDNSSNISSQKLI